MKSARRLALLVIALGALAQGCREHASTKPKPQPSATPCVPSVLVARRGSPVLDGKLDQPVWHEAQATTAFVDEHKDRPVPHTEARASWDESSLYLALYAADDELHAITIAPSSGSAQRGTRHRGECTRAILATNAP